MIESKGRSANEKLRHYLTEATKKSTLPLKVYKETLRSMIREFAQFGYINGDGAFTEVKCFHANPERTIAKLYQENNIILPVITVGQTKIEDDVNRRRYKPLIIASTELDEKKHRAERVIKFADRPVNITYVVNLWAKYMEDLDQLAEQVRLKFNPSLPFITPFSTETKAFLTDEANQSDVATADREDRILRKAFTVSVETYIPSPKFKYTSTGEIEELVLEIDLS